MKRVCVFCGASGGNDPAYAEAAIAVGRYLAENQIQLVYGAGNVGLMGQVADSVLAHGGHAIGVIPNCLVQKEVAHLQLDELHIVESMHQRKALMERLSDAFVALPGGFGTLDELCEILTWKQMGIHRKPIGLLNVNGYYNRFLDFLDCAADKQLLRVEHRRMLHVASHTRPLFELLRQSPTTTRETYATAAEA